MFLNSWSIALIICGLVVLFLMGYAARSGIRVLLFWDPESDSNRQIRLENEIWLTSTLVEYALGVQVVSLIVFVLAADYFSQSIVGAMCATGSLLANDFGVPALIVKIGGVFFYGFWIVLHQLDIRSEKYPLVRLEIRLPAPAAAPAHPRSGPGYYLYRRPEAGYHHLLLRSGFR